MKLSSGVCFVLLGFVLLPLQYGESRTFKLGKWNWIISPSVYLQCNVFSPKWLQFLLFQFFLGGGMGRKRREKEKGSSIKKVWCQGVQPTPMECSLFHHSSKGPKFPQNHWSRVCPLCFQYNFHSFNKNKVKYDLCHNSFLSPYPQSCIASRYIIIYSQVIPIGMSFLIQCCSAELNLSTQ